jgi:tetratricopeptide (TPR) repeat protein
MPEEANRALPLLERALLLEPDYAVAHGYLAWCHEILFVRAGHKDENRSAAVRHAHAAIDHGRDDTTALAVGAFVIAMVEHDRVTAFEAFEQARALSPSSAIPLFLGTVALAWGGEAERAVEWAQSALRVSPRDPQNSYSYHALAISHFLLGRDEEAASAGRRAVRFNPSMGVNHLLMVAPLVRLGRTDEAREASAQALTLMPSFSISGFCAAIGMPCAVAGQFSKEWREAGLPP